MSANKGKRHASQGPDQPACFTCGKPGHRAKDCKLSGTRAKKAKGSVEKSAREAVAEAAGLAEALRDKEKELEDLRSDKDAEAKRVSALEKADAEHLKAELAQRAMSNVVVLGGSRMPMLPRFLTLLAVLLAMVARDTAGYLLWEPLRIILWFIVLVWTSQKGVMGFRIPRTIRLASVVVFLIVGGLICRIFHGHHRILLALHVILLVLRLLWNGMTYMRVLLRTAVSISKLRSCPRRVWVRQHGVYGMISTTMDTRDDTVNSVPLRHAFDRQIKYIVYTPNLLLRSIIDYVLCIACAWDDNMGYFRCEIELVSWHYLELFVGRIELMVSASLARQVLSPRNTPTGLSLDDIKTLVERAASNEGYSNVNSFESHSTSSNLRLNTSLYVQAVHTMYREDLIAAGF